MKKTKKLGLRTETIRDLTAAESASAAGGRSVGTCTSHMPTCAPCDTNYTVNGCSWFGGCTYPTQGLC